MRKKGLEASGIIRLRLLDGDSPDWELPAPGVEGYVIGRTDADSQYIPDIDLAPFNGIERGISRRHAALVVFRGTVHLMDLGSVNGTFINGERLATNSAYALYEGDRVSIANLDILVLQ